MITKYLLFPVKKHKINVFYREILYLCNRFFKPAARLQPPGGLHPATPSTKIIQHVSVSPIIEVTLGIRLRK